MIMTIYSSPNYLTIDTFLKPYIDIFSEETIISIKKSVYPEELPTVKDILTKCTLICDELNKFKYVILDFIGSLTTTGIKASLELIAIKKALNRDIEEPSINEKPYTTSIILYYQLYELYKSKIDIDLIIQLMKLHGVHPTVITGFKTTPNEFYFFNTKSELEYTCYPPTFSENAQIRYNGELANYNDKLQKYAEAHKSTPSLSAPPATGPAGGPAPANTPPGPPRGPPRGPPGAPGGGPPAAPRPPGAPGGAAPRPPQPPSPPQRGGYYSPSLGYRTEPLFKLPPWNPPPLHLKINKKTLRKTRSSKKRTIRSSKKK
jgi:hypothetical protein